MGYDTRQSMYFFTYYCVILLELRENKVILMLKNVIIIIFLIIIYLVPWTDQEFFPTAGNNKRNLSLTVLRFSRVLLLLC